MKNKECGRTAIVSFFAFQLAGISLESFCFVVPQLLCAPSLVADVTPLVEPRRHRWVMLYREKAPFDLVQSID